MNVALSTIALCAGYGGLELGLGAACEHVGWEHRVAAYVEREAYAAALLACRMEAGELDAAPVWSDLTTFDAASWRGAVDCITAGFPCQPHSHAGSRKGIEDERWIWPDIVRIIRESGAWLVVLENVSGLLSSGGFGPVLADLAEMGFDAEWAVLPASAVGASHRRERVFIVAHALRIQRWQRSGRERVLDGDTAVGNTASTRHEERGQRGQRQLSPEAGSGLHDRSELTDIELADTAQQRWPEGWPESARQQGRSDATQRGGELADTSRVNGEQRIGQRQCAAATARGESRLEGCGGVLADSGEPGRQGSEQRIACDGNRGQEAHGSASELCGALFAPGPSDPRWGAILASRPDLAPAIKPGVRLLADGASALVDEHRAHQLRLGGNGVVPLQAGVAIVSLMRRLGLAE